MKENSYNCYLCGKNTMRVRFSAGSYEVCRCSYCSFVETFPKLPAEEILNIYNNRYFNSSEAKNYGYLNYLEEKDNYLKTFKARLGFLEKSIHFDKRLKVLEVGFAYGFFLAVCEEFGFQDLTGVEIARAGWEYAKKNLLKSKLILGQIGAVMNQRFDYIFLWDVIEHVLDPKAYIRRCRELLNDGGYLILETQNVNSIVAKLFGRKWWHYKYPEHLYHFNQKTIAAILEDANFKIPRIFTKSAGKFVSKRFMVERLTRMHSALSKAISVFPFNDVYVNFHDEILVVSKA